MRLQPESGPLTAAPEADLWRDLFEHSPVALRLEDFSALHALFASWRRAGVADLRTALAAEPERVARCAAVTRILAVNSATLGLIGAQDLPRLADAPSELLKGQRWPDEVEDLLSLWNGADAFAGRARQATLDGRVLDLQLKGRLLPSHAQPWDRVLVAVDDVTERNAVLDRMVDSTRAALRLFEHSPVSLWVEDFSGVKRLIQDLRDSGVRDFDSYLDAHPGFVRRCIAAVRVLDVNQHTLDLYRAPDKTSLLSSLEAILRDSSGAGFKAQMLDFWNGRLFQQCEMINHTIDGTPLDVLIQVSVLPGHEDDWSRVLVAATDISARKRAEEHLSFLGRHDGLTRLHNRAFYKDELQRLETFGQGPVTMVIADLNGLKQVNDRLGHSVGDALLMRAGEVLARAVEKPSSASRIGGDEFALVLPGTDSRGAKALMRLIDILAALDNARHPTSPAIDFSLGHAERIGSEPLKDTARRADHAMYQAKRAFYRQQARLI